jgi:hypothetical protein
MKSALQKAMLCLLLILAVHCTYGQAIKPNKSKPSNKSAKAVPPKKVPPPCDGFWLVTKVTVGAREVTPIAKWIKLNEGKQLTGNGWLQHSFGTYKYDKEKAELTLITNNEPQDEFGAFKVTRTGPLMTWIRKEEGDLVTVELKPITDLPIAPSDEAKGLWVLDTATERDNDITKKYDPDHKHFLFIRWDHQFVRQINAHERVSGYWFIDAHEPQMTLVNENRELPDEQWTITVDGQKLVLKGNSQVVRDLVLTYRRATEFPR